MAVWNLRRFEDAMNFSMLTGVRAMIETLPLARAQEGYDRMMSGNARFRVVLATGGTIPFSHD